MRVGYHYAGVLAGQLRVRFFDRRIAPAYGVSTPPQGHDCAGGGAAVDGQHQWDGRIGGRPPSLLALNPGARVVVGADVGATHILVTLTDLSGAVLAEQTDEWAEGRRYLGLDLLNKARLAIIDSASDHPTADAVAPPESIAA